MKIEINRIALYLTGKLPPYYKPYPKFAFIECLEANSEGIFTEPVIDRIIKYIHEDQSFYAECLLRLQKYSEPLFLDFLNILEVPIDARGKMEIESIEMSENKLKFEKKIGFLTPFDSKKNKKLDIFKKITQDVGWTIETFDIYGYGDDRFLWNKVQNFLKEMPLFIIDLREGNKNVLLELGYILSMNKPTILILPEGEKIPSDLAGVVYVREKKIDASSGDDGPKVKAEFEEELKYAIEEKIGEFSRK